MSRTPIGRARPGPPEPVAEGLGWPEGPAVLADGAVLLVEAFRMQVTVVDGDRAPRRYAHTGGAPNACVEGADGALYVCQNGGRVGDWRAPEMVAPSIQRVRAGGRAETLLTEVGGIGLIGPNDLVFTGDGSLVFSDPGNYDPANPEPSYIHRLRPDGTAHVLVAFSRPVYPNGVAAEADGSIVWAESYTGHLGRIRPDGTIEDLGRLPGENPVPDGLKVAADGRLYVTDVVGQGLHVVAPDGRSTGFIPCGAVPTNCAFDGETLWVTDAGARMVDARPVLQGRLWRLHVPGGGGPVFKGSIAALPMKPGT